METLQQVLHTLVSMTSLIFMQAAEFSGLYKQGQWTMKMAIKIFLAFRLF